MSQTGRLSTETHQQSFSQDIPTDQDTKWKRVLSFSHIHTHTSLPTASEREQCLSFRLKSQSWFLSELSCRAGPMSCSFDIKAETQFFLPQLVPNRAKNKNSGGSVIVFTAHLPPLQINTWQCFQPQAADFKGAFPFPHQCQFGHRMTKIIISILCFQTIIQ